MQNEDRYDGLIRDTTEKLFPECDWLLIKSQVAQESGFNPNAKSPCGALGLLQLMPATAAQLFHYTDADLLNPALNLTGGILYLRMQYFHLPEIPGHEERLKFALASYNAGRGYINRALELAYQFEFDEPMPVGHHNARPGKWQTWTFAKEKLKSTQCQVNGRTPDWAQAISYVEKIWPRYLGYKKRP